MQRFKFLFRGEIKFLTLLEYPQALASSATRLDSCGEPAWQWKSLMEEVRKGILSSSCVDSASCSSSLKQRMTPMIVILCSTLSTFCSLLKSSFMMSGLSKLVLSAIRISLLTRTSFLSSVTWLWMCHINVSFNSLMPYGPASLNTITTRA